jgi:hypothetical protein
VENTLLSGHDTREIFRAAGKRHCKGEVAQWTWSRWT